MVLRRAKQFFFLSSLIFHMIIQQIHVNHEVIKTSWKLITFLEKTFFTILERKFRLSLIIWYSRKKTKSKLFDRSEKNQSEKSEWKENRNTEWSNLWNEKLQNFFRFQKILNTSDGDKKIFFYINWLILFNRKRLVYFTTDSWYILRISESPFKRWNAILW